MATGRLMRVDQSTNPLWVDKIMTLAYTAMSFRALIVLYHQCNNPVVNVFI